MRLCYDYWPYPPVAIRNRQGGRAGGVRTITNYCCQDLQRAINSDNAIDDTGTLMNDDDPGMNPISFCPFCGKAIEYVDVPETAPVPKSAEFQGPVRPYLEELAADEERDPRLRAFAEEAKAAIAKAGITPSSMPRGAVVEYAQFDIVTGKMTTETCTVRKGHL